MNVGDTFTHEGIEYTVITKFDNGEVEGRAQVPIGEPGSSPITTKIIIIAEANI